LEPCAHDPLRIDGSIATIKNTTANINGVYEKLPTASGIEEKYIKYPPSSMLNKPPVEINRPENHCFGKSIIKAIGTDNRSRQSRKFTAAE